jgi:D-sedoheptulose 7-phosphate isomerase
MAARSFETVSCAGDYLRHMGYVLESLDAPAVDRFAELVFDAWRDDRCVFTLGNGGSASTASHFVTDFVKTAAVPGARRLRAFCLNDNVPMLSALGNDISYDDAFSYPLESYGRGQELVVMISGSGTSRNVVKAADWAKHNGLVLIGLTGFDGGTLGRLADVHINVPSRNYGVIEDVHMSIGHIVTQMLQSRVAREVGRCAS